MKLYEKFGEFDNCEELNAAAAEALEAGDLDKLRGIAAENGLAEMAEYYIEGDIEMLCDVQAAAVGKLDVENAALEITGLLADWVDCIKALVMNSDELAAAVRRKDKNLAQCMANIMDECFTNSQDVSNEIKNKSSIQQVRNLQKLSFGAVGMDRVKEIVKAYYSEE